jgi:hypothetical protein
MSGAASSAAPLCKQEVAGSIPVRSIRDPLPFFFGMPTVLGGT